MLKTRGPADPARGLGPRLAPVSSTLTTRFLTSPHPSDSGGSLSGPSSLSYVKRRSISVGGQGRSRRPHLRAHSSPFACTYTITFAPSLRIKETCITPLRRAVNLPCPPPPKYMCVGRAPVSKGATIWPFGVRNKTVNEPVCHTARNQRHSDMVYIYPSSPKSVHYHPKPRIRRPLDPAPCALLPGPPLHCHVRNRRIHD